MLGVPPEADATGASDTGVQCDEIGRAAEGLV